MEEWWTRISELPGTDITRNTFFEIYSSADVVFEMPFGIIRLSPIRFGRMGQAHGYFWSRDVLKHLDTFKEIADFCFRMYGFEFILVVVPPFSHGVRKLLTRLDFKWERTFSGDDYYELRRLQ